jgi:hypothetical protein
VSRCPSRVTVNAQEDACGKIGHAIGAAAERRWIGATGSVAAGDAREVRGACEAHMLEAYR